jgi:hypothetical protein
VTRMVSPGHAAAARHGAGSARPCSTTQIDNGSPPVMVHRFLAGSDAVPETRVSQGHTDPAPYRAVGAPSQVHP